MQDLRQNLIESGYRILLIIMIIITSVIMVIFGYIIMGSVIPSDIKIVINEENEFSSSIPITASFKKDSVGVISINDKVLDNKNRNIDIEKQVSIKGNKVGRYTADIKVFGVFVLKKLDVEIVEKKKLIAGGIPVGIYIETDGLLVLGTGEIQGADNMGYSPAKNILKSGDYILAVNGIQTRDKQKFIDYIQTVKDDDIDLTIRRNGDIIHVAVKRIKCTDDSYKIGTWIRNNMQGIGTMTYYDKETKKYGALGHGINDIDTNKLMELNQGCIYSANIVSIVKGHMNKPGELVGVINHNNNYKLGNIKSNTTKGIVGYINTIGDKHILNVLANDELEDEFNIGLSNSVKEGDAYLRCTLGRDIKDYHIRIIKVNKRDSSNKNFVIRIDDEELLKQTNGIVQGMSGSPIFQNGKLIGAVTHVLVNDPTKGYGIFIENMLEDYR